MLKNRIFISDAKGLTPLDEDGKTIAKFKPFYVVDMQQQRGVWKGQLITDKEDVIAKLEAHPSYGKAFKEVPQLPKAISKSNIIAGVRNSGVANPIIPNLDETERAMLKENQDSIKEKYKRLGVLESLVLTKDGEEKKNASIENLEEYRKLKEELGE